MPLKNKDILVVDDSYLNCLLLQKYFQANGYDCVIALHGQTALDIIETKKIDLIFLDIIMPEINGIEILKLIKNNVLTRHIPVIMLSALTDDNSKIESFNNNANEYLTKPIDFKILKGVVSKYLVNNVTKANCQNSNKVDSIINIEELKSSSPYVVEYDILGNILSVKEKFSALFNLSKEEMIGKNIADFDFVPSKFIRDLWSEIEKGNITSKNLYIKKNDKDVLLSETFIPILDRQNKPYRVVHLAYEKEI